MTLTEVTIVMVLASLVMVGLVSFYLSSQAVWMEGSSQAIVQREATLVLEELTRRTRSAGAATVLDVPDTLHQTLELFQEDAGRAMARFHWSSLDSLLYLQIADANGNYGDKQPLTHFRVEKFQVQTLDNRLLWLRDLQLRAPEGQRIHMTSSIALYNAVP